MASEGTARGKERPASHRRPNQLEQLSRRLRLASLAAALRVAGVARGAEEGVHRAVTQLLLSRRLSSPPVPLSACAERGTIGVRRSARTPGVRGGGRYPGARRRSTGAASAAWLAPAAP